MKHRSGFAWIAGIVIASMALTACGSSPSAAKSTSTPKSGSSSSSGKFSVGLVLDVGGVNDKGFNHLAYLGMKAAEAKYGVTGSYVVSNSSADYVPNLTHFAAAHKSIVIGVGFDLANAIYQVAKQYPKEKFALVDSAPANAKGATVNLKNVANLFFEEQQSGYLVGVIAGLMEKDKVGKATHNVIGYMGGQAIPPVIHYIAGYVAGSHAVDPSVVVKGGYSNSFTDQDKAKSIGITQIGSGADILFAVAGLSGLGYLAAAQQKGVYGIGVDADQGYLGKYVITSAIKKVNVAVASIIHDAKTGTFKGGDHEYSLKNSATGFAPTSPLVPAKIVAVAKADALKIKEGKITPPTTIPTY